MFAKTRENLLDDDSVETTPTAAASVAKPAELNRSKTIQKAIEQQNLLEETYKNDTTNSRPCSTTSGESSSSGDQVDVADGPIVPPEPEPKALKRTLSNQSDYDIPVASKTITSPLTDDPYDLPQRSRLESDYDLLPPARKPPIRTMSEDDYDVLPVRKDRQFSQNNNNDDDDYDELPPAPSQPVKVLAEEEDDYDELPPASSRTVKPVDEDDDDYDELPVRKAKVSIDEDEYDIPKGHAE